MSESTSRPTFGSAIACKDPAAALQWLEQAFGFDVNMMIEDEAGKLVHSAIGLRDGYIMVGDEWAANIKAPASTEGANTQRLSVHLPSGIDAHCERARAAGARITMEPADMAYGARSYLAVDPEGHEWDFSMPLDVPESAMQEAGISVQR